MAIQPQYPDNYISSIVDRHVRIKHVAPELTAVLRQLGASEQQSGHESIWVLDTATDQVLAVLLGQLRDLGVLFTDEPSGWPPTAVFEDLRDKGYVRGEFKAVIWRKPGQWIVTSR